MKRKTGVLLGQMLIEHGLLTPAQLDQALDHQKRSSQLLGRSLVELGIIDDEVKILPFVASQKGYSFVQIKNMILDKGILEKISAKFATYYHVIPIRIENNKLIIATEDPTNIQKMDEIALICDMPVQFVLASQQDITEAIREFYGVGAETIDQMMGRIRPAEVKIAETDIPLDESEASISKFLTQILYQAYYDRATDIHIEPFEQALHIRYRIDGVMYDAKVPANIVHFKDSINSRIKILSSLNIAEKRLPQDGRFRIKVKDVELDFRVSFLPTPFGESVVLRLLNTSKLYNLEQLGLNSSERSILENLIQKPNGIVFLTGPTGSGKTTTLYSCLSKLNTQDRKIITIEDPIEYQLKGITQVQINPAVGLTFANGLRSLLRHDPDVMMVGEVRDKETAEIAIQVALTGHLIFSTLHTNDAASGVTRLLDMGVEPFLITSTVQCFIAQRLVRILCPHCKVKKTVDISVMKDLECDHAGHSTIDIYEPKGCEACHSTGYIGRQAIYEILQVNEPIRELIMQRIEAGKIKQAAIKNGMTTLRQAGFKKVQAGLTNPEEIIRVTQGE